MYNFYAYISRMKNIRRWGIMRNTQSENVKEHSLDVAIIAHALALIRNRMFGGEVDAEHIMALAVFHETSEVITGDLPTPIKYFNPKIKNAYKEIERVAAERMIDMVPPELEQDYRELICAEESEEYKEEYKIVKYADKLAAYIKCIEEVQSGNMEFQKAKKRIAHELSLIDAKEVRYFMDNCLHGYTLTLDELN